MGTIRYGHGAEILANIKDQKKPIQKFMENVVCSGSQLEKRMTVNGWQLICIVYPNHRHEVMVRLWRVVEGKGYPMVPNDSDLYIGRAHHTFPELFENLENWKHIKVLNPLNDEVWAGIKKQYEQQSAALPPDAAEVK